MKMLNNYEEMCLLSRKLYLILKESEDEIAREISARLYDLAYDKYPRISTKFDVILDSEC